MTQELFTALQNELKPIFKEWVKEAILELQDEPNTPKSKISTINGYITEEQAKEVLQKGTTWLWEQRKSGKLPYKKLGVTVYYKLEDVKGLLLS